MTMAKFFVVRDSQNAQYAAETLEEAINASQPDKVSDIKLVGVVYADDAGEARLATHLYQDDEVNTETVADALIGYLDVAEDETLEVDSAVIDNAYDKTDLEISALGVEIPEWVESDITIGQLQSIVQGGCASGAYMPAVTYYQANETMAKCGDDVLEYIENGLGELPAPQKGESWSGMAVHYLSTAVELWASSALSEAGIEE